MSTYRSTSVRIEPKPTDAPPSKRIRRLLGVVVPLCFWLSGFGAGLWIDDGFDDKFLALVMTFGGYLMAGLAWKTNGEYGDPKYWHDRFMKVRHFADPNCPICDARPGENCDAGLHS